MAPPTPRSPATNAPAVPRTNRVIASARVTRPGLPHAAEVGGEIVEGLVRDRRHLRLHRPQARIAGTPLVGLEEQHLALEKARGLAAEVGNRLGGVAAAVGTVAERALG